MKVICAIDPGGTTGMAFRFAAGHVGTIAVPSMQDVSKVCDNILEYCPDVIVIEQFVTTGHLSRYGIDTIELVGAVKTLVHLASNDYTTYFGTPHLADWRTTLIRRTPSQRAVFIPKARAYLDKRKAELGTKYVDHEMDALAHLFGYLHSEEPEWTPP